MNNNYLTLWDMAQPILWNPTWSTLWNPAQHTLHLYFLFTLHLKPYLEDSNIGRLRWCQRLIWGTDIPYTLLGMDWLFCLTEQLIETPS